MDWDVARFAFFPFHPLDIALLDFAGSPVQHREAAGDENVSILSYPTGFTFDSGC
jgi:hypothetical protein